MPSAASNQPTTQPAFLDLLKILPTTPFPAAELLVAQNKTDLCRLATAAQSSGDFSAFFSELAKHYQIDSIHPEVQTFIKESVSIKSFQSPLELEGALVYLGQTLTFKNEKFMELFPAFAITSDIWLMLETGNLVTIHHDSWSETLRQARRGVVNRTQFFSRLEEIGSLISFQQYLWLQQLLLEGKFADAAAPLDAKQRAQVLLRALATVLGKKPGQLRKLLDDLRLEFVHSITPQGRGYGNEIRLLMEYADMGQFEWSELFKDPSAPAKKSTRKPKPEVPKNPKYVSQLKEVEWKNVRIGNYFPRELPTDLSVEMIGLEGCTSINGIGKYTQLKHLRLSGKLAKLPLELLQCTQLETLFLYGHNKINQEQMWSVICQLPKLKRLTILGCGDITQLPDNFTHLTNLEELTLLHPQFSSTHEYVKIAQLPQLVYLDIAGAIFTEVLDCFSQFQKLQILNIGCAYRPERQLPLDVLFKTAALVPHLQSLIINQRYKGLKRIYEVPASIGLLQSLKHLDLFFNSAMKMLPPEIAQLTKLAELDVRGTVTATEKKKIQRWVPWCEVL